MMTSATDATTSEETPTYFESDRGSLFGILTRPTAGARGVAVILLSGGGTPLSTYRNRLWVRLSRQLAARGYHTMRFDYHGVGESDGTVDRFRLDRPFVDDLRGALRFLESVGISRFVLVGSCFGARTALACSPDIAGLEALALIAPPVRDFEMGYRLATDLAIHMSLRAYALKAMHPRVIRRLFDPDHRRAYARIARVKCRQLAHRDALGSADTTRGAIDGFVQPLAAVSLRGVPILLLYGEQDDLWDQFQRARGGLLEDLLTDPGLAIDIMTIPGEVHGLSSVRNQDAVVKILNGWLDRKVPPEAVVTPDLEWTSRS